MLDNLNKDCGGERKQWLFELAKKSPRAFATVLAKVIPTESSVEMKGDSNRPVQIVSYAGIADQDSQVDAAEAITTPRSEESQ